MSKLKINYVNDLHIDFHAQFVVNQLKYEKSVREYAQKLISGTEDLGDILIISGDLGHVNRASYWFLDEVCEEYSKVVITYGNHDLYMLSKSMKNKYRNSWNRVREFYELTKKLPNVHFLGEEFDGVLSYQGFKIGGEILMSNPKTEKEIMFYNEKMNDSKMINFGFYKNENATYLNRKNIKYYSKLKEEGLDIFVSHYPIITTNSHLRYGVSDGSLGSYKTDVEEFIAQHNFYGHVHEQEKSKLLGHNFYTQAIGYPSENLTKCFGYVEISK